MSGPPRACRWCAHMTCGDANWCEALRICMSDAQLPRIRRCQSWMACTMAADSFDEWKEPAQKTTGCAGQTRLEI